MAGIVGLATTFNTPNYVGELFGITPEDTPFLSAIGGLTGGEQTTDTRFAAGSTYDLRAAGQNTRVEGADAPAGEARVRTGGFNVVEIHQEAVEVSFTRQAVRGRTSPQGGVQIAGANVVTDEMGWQLEVMLKQIARDIEYSFIRGTFADPANNATPRKTRGLLEAIVTNVTANAPAAALTAAMVLDTMQAAWTNGGFREQVTATLMTGAKQKRNLTKLFITDANYRTADRNVAGVSLQTIETDFGVVNVMLNRHMPDDSLLFVSLEQCAPVFLLIPEDPMNGIPGGFLFTSPLHNTGAAFRKQIYGEVGLAYGNERSHAKITGLL
jgi:hypothetical protein